MAIGGWVARAVQLGAKRNLYNAKIVNDRVDPSGCFAKCVATLQNIVEYGQRLSNKPWKVKQAPPPGSAVEGRNAQ